MPSRNIRADRFSFLTASAGFRENKNKGDSTYENESKDKTNVIHPLYGADCGYGTLYNGL